MSLSQHISAITQAESGGGGLHHYLAAHSIVSLDQSPPASIAAVGHFVTPLMMASSPVPSAVGSRSFGKIPSQAPAPIHLSRRPPPLKSEAHEADLNLNWRRRALEPSVPFHSHHRDEEVVALKRQDVMATTLSSLAPSSSLFHRYHEKRIDHVVSPDDETIDTASTPLQITSASNAQTALKPSTSTSNLTAALLNAKNTNASNGSSALARAPSISSSQCVLQPEVSDLASHEEVPGLIDDTQELLGRTGDGLNKNAVYIVRSKIDGQLAIFKPREGESSKEEMSQQRRYNIMQDASGHFSPSFSSSFGISPSEPSTPFSLQHTQERQHISSLRKIGELPPKTPLKRGVDWGETAIKEAAAFALDEGLSGVPKTVTATLLVPRDGRALPMIDPTSIKPSPLLLHGSCTLPSLPVSSSNPDDDIQAAIIPRSSAIAIGNKAEGMNNQRLDVTLSSSPLPEVDPNLQLTPRFGSLSTFVPHLSNAEEFGASLFSVEDVHRVGILDCRILNLDRHLANLLVSKDEMTGAFKLIPIDHGFSLPSFRDLRDVRFEWTDWRQTFEPFSEASLAFIAALDPVRDAAKLQAVGIKYESLIALIFSTLLLKRGAEKGLVLHEIASALQRPHMQTDSIIRQTRSYTDSDEEEDASTCPSVLERIVSRVWDSISQSFTDPWSSISSPTDTQTRISSSSCSPSAHDQLSSSLSTSLAIDPSVSPHPSSCDAAISTANLNFNTLMSRVLTATTSVIDAELNALLAKRDAQKTLRRN